MSVSKKLLRRYVQSLPRKRDALRQGRHRLLRDDETTAHEVRFEAHRLAGAAASYGFPDITKAARAAEHAQGRALLTALDALLDAIEAAIRHSSITPQPTQVLVVQSDDACRARWRQALSPQQVHEATSLETAADALDNVDDIDVVIVELALHDDDGSEVVRHMRSSPRHRLTSVIIMSDEPANKRLEPLLELGVDCYLEKPVAPSLIRAAVHASVRRNQAIQKQARTDGLTGVANRAGYLEQTARLASLARRNGMKVALALLDLDHFKTVNDTYGHLVGDEVLREFSEVLGRTIRGTDVLGRWGGEEFAITFPDTEPSGARIALEKFRDVLRTRSMSAQGLRITFSAGVSALDPYAELDRAIDAADELLYVAKDAGRNVILDALPETPRRWKVALVDHDQDIANLLREVLRPAGFDVLHFHRWNELVLARTNADLLLVDLDSKEGEQAALDSMASRPAALKVPSVALTNESDPEFLERAFAAGFDDQVGKPFDTRELVARLRRLID